MYLIVISLLILISLLFLLEIINFSIPSSPLTIEPYNVQVTNNLNLIKVEFDLLIKNPKRKMDVMISDFNINLKLLGTKSFSNIRVDKFISTKHKDLKNRRDNYWQSYIVKSLDSTKLSININLQDPADNTKITDINSIWIDINWCNYGPFGRLIRKDGFAIPIRKEPDNNNISLNKSPAVPIKTHLLGILDDPLQIIRQYALPHSKHGDVITIGETPLAIMQGKYIHPLNIKVTTIARLICLFFHPTSSLATACGMQVLINEVGPTRVLFSLLFGGVLKLIKVKGIFYRLAGYQACLIDDITGTTPPYDQTIVLGPSNPKDFCNTVKKELGFSIAVVDVNDLGRVKVLACSDGCNTTKIRNALGNNPAGNADQMTPLVIVRNA